MNLRVDDLLNADRYYTTAAGRPKVPYQPRRSMAIKIVATLEAEAARQLS
jgi:hypothetical protein